MSWKIYENRLNDKENNENKEGSGSRDVVEGACGVNDKNNSF